MIKEEWKNMYQALKDNFHNGNPFKANLKGTEQEVKRLDTKHVPGEYNTHGCYIYPEVYKALFHIEDYGKVTICHNRDDDCYYLAPAKDF